MARLLVCLALLLGGVGVLSACSADDPAGQAPSPPAPGSAGASPDAGLTLSGDAVLAEAFRERARNLQVEGRGTVVRVLADDSEGGRHQRFILRLDSGQTLLIAHNIDLAPRLRTLRVRDSVAFFGEYEWNEQGGAIHWTHRDPAGTHVAGWLKHRGRVYQ